MSQAWRVMARNYARYDTPLRPGAEPVDAIRGLLPSADALVVVLGATPDYAKIAKRTWFIDVTADALRLVPRAPKRRLIRKDWLDAGEEFEQADMIAGDASVNNLESPEAAERLLHTLAKTRKRGSILAQRIFVRHGLARREFERRMAEAFAVRSFSAARFLVYGVIADSSGLALIAEVDRYIEHLEEHVRLDPLLIEAYKAEYFEWRGLSPRNAASITTRAFIPSRRQIDAMLTAAGIRAVPRSAGTFPLAEYTPLYTASG